MKPRVVWDVVVLGGGFAGLAFAQRLDAGLTICGVEAQPRAGARLRTTGSTFLLPGRDLFSQFGVDLELVTAQFQRLDVVAPHARSTVDFGRPVWALLDVPRLLRQMFEGQSTRVEWRFDTHALSIESAPWGASVRVESDGKIDKIHGRLIVDATGASGRLESGVALPRYRARCAQMDIELDSSHDSSFDEGRVELYPGSTLSPRGYGYVFPIDSHHARVGVCTAGRKDFDVAEALAAFASERVGRWRHSKHVFQCEAVSGGRVRKLFDGRVLALGDRAGHLSPVMGEGIRFAFLAADLAAPLAEAWLGGDHRAFERFESAWRQVAGRRHEWALLAQRILAFVGTRSFDSAVRRVAAAANEDPDLWLRVLSTSFVRSDLRRLVLARSA